MKIEIDFNHYKQLLQAQLELSCLEDGGVDNWSYYSECFDDEYVKELKEIQNMKIEDYEG